MELVITPPAQVRCVYDEALPLPALGRLDIRRGSHVEPDATRPLDGRSGAGRRTRVSGRSNSDVRPWRPKSLGFASIGSSRRRPTDASVAQFFAWLSSSPRNGSEGFFCCLRLSERIRL